MSISLCLLLVSLTAYVPYFLADENRLTYKGDIVINKSPLHMAVYSGYIGLLVIAVCYQYFTKIDIPSIENFFWARLLTGGVFSYLALLSLMVKIKDYKLLWIDAAVLTIVGVSALSFILSLISSQVFSIIAAAILCWIFLKYIGSINIL